MHRTTQHKEAVTVNIILGIYCMIDCPGEINQGHRLNEECVFVVINREKKHGSIEQKVLMKTISAELHIQLVIAFL